MHVIIVVSADYCGNYAFKLLKYSFVFFVLYVMIIGLDAVLMPDECNAFVF